MLSVKNRKEGFSLIELLIVVAVLGVISLVAFAVFSGVLGDSKKRGDEIQAQNIERALNIYLSNSGDVDLSEARKPDGSSWGIVEGTSWTTVVVAFQDEVIDSKNIVHGPLLRNPNGGTFSITASSYEPSWNLLSGGKNVGYRIDLYPKVGGIKVRPVQKDDEAIVHINN